MSGTGMAAGSIQQDERLLEIINNLVKELRGANGARAHLDSAFDRDLGLDSLARVELVLRVERAFAVRLPESALGEAETARALLAVIAAAGGGVAVERAADFIATSDGPGRGAPVQAATLVEVLEWHVAAEPDRVHIYLYSGDDPPTPLTYRDLYNEAQRVAAGLRGRGVAPGQAVALMLPTGRDFLVSFFGILLAGAVPAPLYPPVRRAAAEEHLRRQAVILNNCLAPLLITLPEVSALSAAVRGLAPALQAVLTMDELAGDGPAERPRVRGADLALLQYTSGSTGDPKGVMLTHDNLLANVRAMGQAAEVRGDDVFVSWLPLYHDMGLIGAWLGSLYHGLPLVLMSPLTFLARPVRWLRAIHRHRGTLSAGPNFAYELCAGKITDEELAGIDLSTWRLAFNGAEQVSAETVRRFSARFAPYGFRLRTMAPVYGLAESSVGLAFPPLGREPVIDYVARAVLASRGWAEPQPAQSADTASFVACGRALPGHALRVVDERDQPCEDRREGRVQFRGPSSCQGYFRNPEATARLIYGDWLDSGDRGYLVAGELFITGRIKDIIIRAGHNIYPYELESAVGALAGIRGGGVAAFASRDERLGTDRLVILAETRETRDPQREQLRAAITEAVVGVIGNPPDEVVLAPPRTVLKTSSGKVRRDATRRRYERGETDHPPAPPWRQALGLASAGLGTWLWRGAGQAAAGLFAAYVWLVFLAGACLAVAGAVALPTLRARQTACKQAARLTAILAGIRITVDGQAHLAGDAPRIVVANHASYVDALILTAALPVGLHYVAKRELADQPVVGWCLRRIGCEFVERFDTQQSAAAANRLEEKVRAGHSLVFFPEGTFGTAPGLRPFRMGAFIAAARAGVAVVPVALRGTRAILPSGSWWPRRGAAAVIVGAPLRAPGEDWRAAVDLRDRARAEILRASGEPELIALN